MNQWWIKDYWENPDSNSEYLLGDSFWLFFDSGKTKLKLFFNTFSSPHAHLQTKQNITDTRCNKRKTHDHSSRLEKCIEMHCIQIPISVLWWCVFELHCVIIGFRNFWKFCFFVKNFFFFWKLLIPAIQIYSQWQMKMTKVMKFVTVCHFTNKK